MAIFYFAAFVMGTLLGVLYGRQSITEHRNQLTRHHDRLDDVDQMVLWGEATNDDFYKGR